MSIVDDALEKLEANKAKLVHIQNPDELIPGSIEIDTELLKIARNLKVLDSLIYIAGNARTQLQYEHRKRSAALTREWTADKLAEIGVVKSDKFKVIRDELAEEERALDEMSVKYYYFRGMKETFIEMGNHLKKVRKLD